MPIEAADTQPVRRPTGAAGIIYKGSDPMKNVNVYGVEVGEGHVWLDERTCVLRTGKINYKLTGIIRGAGIEPLTYFFHSYRDLDTFVLHEWIYYIKAV